MTKATLPALLLPDIVYSVYFHCVFIILTFDNYNVIASDMFLILLFVVRLINKGFRTILGLQSVSRDVADNVSLPRRLDPSMELITYSFALYLQHGRYDVKCKLSIISLSN